MKNKSNWIILSLLIIQIALFKFLPYYFKDKTMFNLPAGGLLFSAGLVLLFVLIIVLLIYTISTIKNKRFDKFRILTIVFGWVVLLIMFFTNPTSDWNEGFKSQIVYRGTSGMVVIPPFELVIREDGKFEYQNNIPKSERYFGKYKIKNDTVYLNFDKNAVNYGNSLVYKTKGFAMYMNHKSPKSKHLPDTIYFNGNETDFLEFIKKAKNK